MAGVDIFNNPYKTTETWSAQGAIVNWGVGDTDPAQAMPFLMLQLNMQYQRRVQSFYPINVSEQGDGLKVNINGAPQGTLTVGSIYHPSATSMTAFITAVSKACKTTTEQVTLLIQPFGSKDCGTTTVKNHKLKLTGLELETVGLQIQGGEAAVVNMPTSYSFTGLNWSFE